MIHRQQKSPTDSKAETDPRKKTLQLLLLLPIPSPQASPWLAASVFIVVKLPYETFRFEIIGTMQQMLASDFQPP